MLKVPTSCNDGITTHSIREQVRTVMDPLFDESDLFNWQWDFSYAQTELKKLDSIIDACYKYHMAVGDAGLTYEERSYSHNLASEFQEVGSDLGYLAPHMEAYANWPAFLLKKPQTWRIFYKSWFIISENGA